MKVCLFILCMIPMICTGQNDRQAAREYQRALDAEYMDPDRSPLLEEDRLNFKGFDYYPIKKKYIVQARFERVEGAEPFEMKTSTDRLPLYYTYGIATFEIDGTLCQLHLYRNVQANRYPRYKDKLFVPFKDYTNGETTYGGGRYMYIDIPKDDVMTINFHKSFNPLCAYNDKYSCPIPPAENHLEVAIEAGIKFDSK